MGSVRRSTLVTGVEILDATIESVDMANRAVSRPKMSWITQNGSATPGTVAYGTPFKDGEPIPQLTPISVNGVPGTARIKRIATASFDFNMATPVYAGWTASGSA